MLKKALLSILAFTVFLALLTIGIYWSLLRPEQAPDRQVFINAKVLTMDSNNRIAQAIAVENDIIISIGSNSDIETYIDNNTVIHDLTGKTLLPGFIDAHSHFPGVGLGDISVNLNSPPIGNVKSIIDIKQLLSDAAESKKSGEWLIGVGYDDSLLKEKRHLTRDDLDEISTTLPIYIMHISGHFAVANSLGLELSGIDENTPAIEGGVYVKDKSGRLTGLLEETARIKTADLAFDLSLMDFIRMCKQGAQEYAAAGVTTAQSGLTSEKFIQGLSFVKSLGMIPQRLVIWPDMETGKQWAEGQFNASKFNADNFTIGAVKLVADGSIQGYTGFLTKPYHIHSDEHSNEHSEEYRGYPTMPQKELNATVLKLHKAGLQIAIHANGDAALDAIIEAIEQAQQQAPRNDSRHIAVHAQMTTQTQLEKMLALGITPSFFSAHTYYWGDRHRDIFLGQERAKKISPLRSAQKLGLPFSIHLDSPVVPMNPLFAAQATVNRLTSSGKVLGEDERIDAMQALRSVTIDAAWQVFLEKDRGSIEAGKKADLVVLDKNPLLAFRDNRKVQVVKTFIGGVPVYSQ